MICHETNSVASSLASPQRHLLGLSVNGRPNPIKIFVPHTAPALSPLLSRRLLRNHVYVSVETKGTQLTRVAHIRVTWFKFVVAPPQKPNQRSINSKYPCVRALHPFISCAASPHLRKRPSFDTSHRQRRRGRFGRRPRHTSIAPELPERGDSPGFGEASCPTS